MRSIRHRFAVLAAAVALLGEAPAASDDAARIFALTGARTAAVRSYTSRVNVDFALRSFPYLRFHLTGHVSFRRPNLYSVHFDHVPWFGKGFENMKMDALQPATWLEHYDVTSVDHHGDRTFVEMRDKVSGNVNGVHAELDTDGLRRIQWSYVNGGRISVHVNPSPVAGIPLPATEDADIKLPGYHVVARASFTDYQIVTDSAAVDDGR